MKKEEIVKQVLEIFNKEENWYNTKRNGDQLDIAKTMNDVVEWVAKIIGEANAKQVLAVTSDSKENNKKGEVAVCGYCNGVGTFILENNKIICSRCKGTGKQTGC